MLPAFAEADLRREMRISRIRARDERGFTLIEIMVAISVMAIGVLGVTTMVSVSNRTTVANNSRQGATNLLRRTIETARSLPFRSIKSATLVTDIQTTSPDLNTVQAGTWKVQRDSYTYTLTATVCRVDDDSDGYGAHDTADPTFCSDSSTTGTADDAPGDYKRVSVTVSWTVGGDTRSVKQVTLVPPGGTGDSPSVTDVHATSPAASAGQPLLVTTQPSPSSITFSATTDRAPSYMTWLIDGTEKITCPPTVTGCSGSGNSWSFTWNIGAPTIDTNSSSVNYNKCIAPTGTSTYVYDGTYQVGAMPLDSNGLAGSAASQTVTINRCTPIQPPNFNATGRNTALGTMPIDIEWDDNPEGDIVGYKVYRGTSIANGTPICPPNASDPPIDYGQSPVRSCIDYNPPVYNKNNALYYGVYAYDQSPSGVVRQGALSYVEVNTAQNSAPKAPVSVAAAASGSDVNVTWKTPATPFDPDTGDTIDSFRVYRRAVGGSTWTPAQRIDYDSMTAYCNGQTTAGANCSFTDVAPGGPHEYMVTSVDTHLRESAYPNNGFPIA